MRDRFQFQALDWGFGVIICRICGRECEIQIEEVVNCVDYDEAIVENGDFRDGNVIYGYFSGLIGGYNEVRGRGQRGDS